MANKRSMPRPKSDKDASVTIVLAGAWLEDAQQLVADLSQPGMSVTRADVLRLALRKGLDALQAETAKHPSKR
jgi:hypothetical protein